MKVVAREREGYGENILFFDLSSYAGSPFFSSPLLSATIRAVHRASVHKSASLRNKRSNC